MAGEDPRDPLRLRSRHEVQSITCSALGGSVRMAFLGLQTGALPWNAYVLEQQNQLGAELSLEAALGNLSSIGQVQVGFAEGSAASLSDGDRRLCTTTKSKFL